MLEIEVNSDSQAFSLAGESESRLAQYLTVQEETSFLPACPHFRSQLWQLRTPGQRPAVLWRADTAETRAAPPPAAELLRGKFRKRPFADSSHPGPSSGDKHQSRPYRGKGNFKRRVSTLQRVGGANCKTPGEPPRRAAASTAAEPTGMTAPARPGSALTPLSAAVLLGGRRRLATQRTSHSSRSLAPLS